MIQLGFDVPEQSDLEVFFGAQATDAKPEDGYWSYEWTDAELTWRLSFNVLEGSVQTELSFCGQRISTVSHEGALRMLVEPSELRCEFAGRGSTGSLTLKKVGKRIEVNWSTLRSE